MIVGGGVLEDGRWKSSDKAYGMSLNSRVKVPTCLESICDFPHYVYNPTTAIFQDGLPTVCGGSNLNTNPYTNYVECHKYNFTDAWTYSGSMEHHAAYGKSFFNNIEQISIYVLVIVSAQSYHAEWGMVMIAKDWLQISQDGESFETWNRGVPVFYEEGLGGFCQVAIDDNLIFVAGGWKGAEESAGNAHKDKAYKLDIREYFVLLIAFIFDLRSGWRRLPDMIRARHSMMCGLVTDRRGNKKIVIAGGHSA